MQPTILTYLEDFNLLEDTSTVVDLLKESDKDIVLLDKTIFYPQGGGQPYDQGIIKNEHGVFKVQEVRFVDGIVKHIGQFESGKFEKDQKVSCIVEKERRELHCRLHSAGHLVDMAVVSLGLGWIPGKGFHFPEGPYVEYEGSLEGVDKEELKQKLEDACNKFIQEGAETKLVFMDKEKMKEVCHHVPDYIPENKPARVVMYGNFGVPCGGTHVRNIADVKKMVIRKIKPSKGNIRIGYDIE